jgi:hypothetical protein
MMTYYKVTADSCVPSVFAVSTKTDKVFCHNEAMGGAFVHPETVSGIDKFLASPGITVKKDFGKVFKSLENWWSLEDAKDYIECLIAEKEC